jgi:hypothetical protein
MRSLTWLAALAGVLVCSSSAFATLVTTQLNATNGTDSLPNPYPVSSTDLLTGLTATNVTGNFTAEGTGGVPILNDGLTPSPVTRDTGGAFEFGSFATAGNIGGTSLTYVLSTPTNLTSIAVFGGWQDGGRDEQGYSILYSTSAAPTTFLPLVTNFDFNPPDPTGHPQLTKVTFSDDTGILASDVYALKFNFNAVENGYTGYTEIDAFGSPVPEPATLTMLAFGGIGLLLGKRRRKT